MFKVTKNSIWEFSNPLKFKKLAGILIPIFGVIAFVCVITGLSWGFFYTPDDYKQGPLVKIIYVHVPSAFLAINIYLMMFLASLIWLIRRHHLSALAAKAAAPVGLAMTFIAIVSGAFWGKPTWGTYWVWDPRLTSFAIMLVFYISYIALWNAISNRDKAADLTSILCLTGSIFAVLSRGEVNAGTVTSSAPPLNMLDPIKKARSSSERVSRSEESSHTPCDAATGKQKGHVAPQYIFGRKCDTVGAF